MTISEARLWGAIKARQTGARFRRQVPIGRWIADFASLDPRLVVEVDDRSHDYRDESLRNEDLARHGFSIVRFDNAEVAQDLDAVFNTIVTWVDHLRIHRTPPY